MKAEKNKKVANRLLQAEYKEKLISIFRATLNTRDTDGLVVSFL
jgi:hypothetical protein